MADAKVRRSLPKAQGPVESTTLDECEASKIWGESLGSYKGWWASRCAKRETEKLRAQCPLTMALLESALESALSFGPSTEDITPPFVEVYILQEPSVRSRDYLPSLPFHFPNHSAYSMHHRNASVLKHYPEASLLPSTTLYISLDSLTPARGLTATKNPFRSINNDRIHVCRFYR